MEKKLFTACVLDGRICHRKNGFILLEMVLASSLTALIVLAMLPAAVQSVRMYEYSCSWQETALQGIHLEDTLTVSLASASSLRVTDSSVRFLTDKNLRSGFLIRQGVIYKCLDDGTVQPVTGTEETGRNKIIVEQLEPGCPFFSQEDGCVRAAMNLKHEAGCTWRCDLWIYPGTGITHETS